MDEIAKHFGEYMKEGSGTAPEYTAEQTTGFLLAFIDQMQATEEQKATLRSNILERAMNPDKFLGNNEFERKSAAPTPQEIMKLLALVVLVLFVLGFFGYKLYKSIMEKEQKGKKNKKEEKKSKKINSPPSSPRSKKEK